MSTMRYSGEIRIRITYLEPYLAGDGAPAGRSTMSNGEYRCFLREPDGMGTTIHVGAPAFLTHAVDSPEAFDAVARAALSFAHNAGWPVEAHAPWVDGAAWHIGRSPAKAWPKEFGEGSLNIAVGASVKRGIERRQWRSE
jgi:hypothetical protein